MADGHNDVLTELEHVLRAQLEGYERLLAAILTKREAIRQADIDTITKLCHEENEIAQQLGDLEKYRLELVGRLTEAVNPQAAQPLSITEIIALASADGVRERLTELVEALRSAVGEVRRESAIVRRAADALSTHMTGLMQKVQSALSGLPRYGRRGRIAVDESLSCAVDVTS